MRRIIEVSRENIFYRFDPDIPPAASAKPGDLIEFECVDALGGQIRSEKQTVDEIDWGKVNPATGPVYVEGAEAGDALIVRILRIELEKEGVTVTVAGEGALPDLARTSRTRICRVLGSFVEFMGLRIETRKMVGVIGVASSEKASTGVPGKHGGNLDARIVTEGSEVYLPVEYAGALLGVGDLHAAMGDGEVCISACEVSGRVLAEVEVAKGLAPRWPIVRYGNSYYILVSSEGLENAVRTAVEEAVEILRNALSLDWYDAYMLASLAVDLEISQIVDPRKTVRVRIPANLLGIDELLRAASQRFRGCP